MKKLLKRKFTKLLGRLGITPYVFYVYKFNDPFLIKKKLFNSKSIVIFDVGAHDGRSVSLYKKYFPLSKIFSFEPTPDSFKQLSKNNEKFEDAFSFNIALSSLVGSTDLFLNNSSLTNSLLKSSNIQTSFSKAQETKGKITVVTNTIDNFCNENKINHIHILKIDVQGADLEVLKGSQQMLEEQKIDLIFIEVEFIQLYENQGLFHDISSFLNSHNYHLFSLYNLSVGKDGQLIYGDAVFLSKSIAQAS